MNLLFPLWLRKVFFLAVVTLLVIPSLKAQVLVDLSIKRTLYIAYEPLLATVRITNLSGNRLLLADVEGKPHVGVHDAAVLHVAARADGDPFVVAAQHDPEPYARVLAQPHATDDRGVGGDPEISAGRRFRGLSVE